MDFLHLPKRTEKKRQFGLTSVADFGIPLEQLKSILNNYGQFIDFAKIGIGTAYTEPNIQEKINLYKEHEIHAYFGGTLFEKSYYQNKLDDYIKILKKLGIDWIEISTGTIDIPLSYRLELIHQWKENFNCLAEVGSKDPEKPMSINEWKLEIKLLLEAGCKYVITEGRDSGTSGIYDKNGHVHSQLIDELIADINPEKIIFEAPTAKQQMYFINAVGPNVNLGNIKLQDALILETERLGLRSETFFMEEHR